VEDSVADLLIQYVREFETSEEATQDSRKLAERDRDYYDEKQWTAEEKSALEKRGQPAVTYNRIKRKVNALLGLEKSTRKDPKAFPRNPDDEAAAQAATDAIRYVCEDSRWDDKRSLAAKELAVEGTCAVMVGVRRGKGGIDPDIRRISWDRFYYDAHACEFDFTDASYMGVVIWMDMDKALARWPDAKDVLETTMASYSTAETYDDKPKWQMWADYKRKRVRICEHYCLGTDGWTFSLFTKAGFIVEPQPSPYLGDDGEPECPIKAVSLYIDRDNNRYGEVRTMIGPQDDFNKRRSKSLHLISQRQVRISQNVQMDAREVRKELSRPDGVFVGDKDDVEVLPTNDMAAANLQLMQLAGQEMELLGPNAALQGKADQGMSGRAILAQQQGGMNEAATYLDCIRVLSLAVYRSVWSRIQQHWTGERWVRVTDNEQNLRFVGLNQAKTALQMMAEKMGITKETLPQAMQEAPQMVQQLQAFAADPRSQQVVAVENNVAELDVDIVVDEGIDTPTVEAEQFDTLLKMVGTGAIPIPPDVLIEASSLRNKDRLLEMLKQGPSPEQQKAVEIQLAGEAAKVEETQSKTAKNMADAEATQAEIGMQAFQTGQQAGMAA
jgi:hypothetical protein